MEDKKRVLGTVEILVLIGLATSVVGLLLLALGGPGHRLGFWNFRFGLTLVRISVWVGLGGAAVSLLGLLVGLMKRHKKVIAPAVVGIVIGGGLFSFGMNLKRIAETVPRIHDITTDTEDPPKFLAVLPLRAGAMNPANYEGEAVARQQKEAYPDIVPLVLEIPPHEAFEKALAAAKAMGWEIVRAAPREGRIEATDTTLFFGFKDDVVVRVTSPMADSSRIDVRSKSRVGISDLGANAERIREFLEKVRS